MTGLHGLAWRSLRARPLRTILTIDRRRPRRRRPVRRPGHQRRHRRGRRPRRRRRWSAGPTCASPASARPACRDATVDAVAATPGVAVAAPAFERRTYLGLDLFAPGDALPAPVTVVGIVPAAEAAIHDLTLADGTALPDDASTLDRRAGQRDPRPRGRPDRRRRPSSVQGPAAPTTVPGRRHPGRRRAVGRRDRPRRRRPAGRRPGGLRHGRASTRIDLALEPGRTPQRRRRGPPGRRSSTRRTSLSSPARPRRRDLRASTGEFAATTALIAAVALFAGAFLIFNTLSMTVVERLRELGLLRAAGATRGQLTSFILVQAVVIGLVGSLLGVALGVGLATVMAGWVGTVGSVARGRPDPRAPGPRRGRRHRPRGDPRRGRRAGPSRRPRPTGRGPQGPARAAVGPSGPGPLAGRRVRRRRRRRAPGLAARRRGRRARPLAGGLRPRCCSSSWPSRSCCRP